MTLLPPIRPQLPLEQGEPPKRLTVGEIRRKLEAMGNPWTVDPSFRDDDSMPIDPAGGSDVDMSYIELLKGDLTPFIQRLTPAHSVLSAYWLEMPILDIDFDDDWVSPNSDETIESAQGDGL